MGHRNRKDQSSLVVSIGKKLLDIFSVTYQSREGKESELTYNYGCDECENFIPEEFLDSYCPNCEWDRHADLFTGERYE